MSLTINEQKTIENNADCCQIIHLGLEVGEVPLQT